MRTRKLIIVGIAAVIGASASASPLVKKSLYERLGGIQKIAATVDMGCDMEAKDPILNKNSRFKTAVSFNRAFVKFAITNTLAAGTGGPQKCVYSVLGVSKWMNLTKAQSDRAWEIRWMAAKKVGIPRDAFMDMKAWYMRAESQAKAMAPTMETFQDKSTLYARLGGIMPIASVVDDFVNRIATDKTIGSNPRTVKALTSGRVTGAGLKYLFTELLAKTAGGPYSYSGRSMKEAHKNLMISEKEWSASGALFKQTLDKFKVGEKEQQELFTAIAATHGDVVKAAHK